MLDCRAVPNHLEPLMEYRIALHLPRKPNETGIIMVAWQSQAEEAGRTGS